MSHEDVDRHYKAAYRKNHLIELIKWAGTCGRPSLGACLQELVYLRVLAALMLERVDEPEIKALLLEAGIIEEDDEEDDES